MERKAKIVVPVSNLIGQAYLFEPHSNRLMAYVNMFLLYIFKLTKFIDASSNPYHSLANRKKQLVYLYNCKRSVTLHGN